MTGGGSGTISVDPDLNVSIAGGVFYGLADVDLGNTTKANNVDLDLDGDNSNVVIFIISGGNDSDLELTGIDGGTDGRHIILVNNRQKKLRVLEETDSAADNQFLLRIEKNETNDGSGSFELVYSEAINKWIVFRATL